MKNAGKACNNRLYRHIRTFEKIIKNYFVIYFKSMLNLQKKYFFIKIRYNEITRKFSERLRGQVKKQD